MTVVLGSASPQEMAMQNPAEQPDRRSFALGLRLFAIACLASMSALVKLAELRGTDLLEIMFCRQFLALPPVLAWVAIGPGFASLKTARLGAHATRTLYGLIGMVATFGALILLPLAVAATLQFTVPIFATILATLLLKEVAGIHRWSAVVVGFVGVLVVVRPGGGEIPLLGGAVGLIAAFMVALISIQLRTLGRTEPAATTVFWFSLLSSLVLAITLPFVIQAHDLLTWTILAGIGVIGGIGQMALTASLRWAPVSTVVPMDYSSLIWATLYGWLLFGALPGAGIWLGAPLIIASGLYIVWREHKLSRHNTETATAAAD